MKHLLQHKCKNGKIKKKTRKFTKYNQISQQNTRILYETWQEKCNLEKNNQMSQQMTLSKTQYFLSVFPLGIPSPYSRVCVLKIPLRISMANILHSAFEQCSSSANMPIASNAGKSYDSLAFYV